MTTCKVLVRLSLEWCCESWVRLKTVQFSSRKQLKKNFKIFVVKAHKGSSGFPALSGETDSDLLFNQATFFEGRCQVTESSNSAELNNKDTSCALPSPVVFDS